MYPYIRKELVMSYKGHNAKWYGTLWSKLAAAKDGFYDVTSVVKAPKQQQKPKTTTKPKGK